MAVGCVVRSSSFPPPAGDTCFQSL